MPRKIDRDKTVEEQVWDDIAGRIEWFTAKQVSKKLSVPLSTVKKVCNSYYKKSVLDKKLLNNTNYYRVKP